MDASNEPEVEGEEVSPRLARRVLGNRKVSIPLCIGIVVMPYIFAWFLLRKGHSQQSRILGFGWLAVLVAMASLPRTGVVERASSTASQPGAKAVDIDPDRAAKDMAAELAKEVVPSALKDPSSADFGEVRAMSATVACGTVNGKNSFGAMTGQTQFIFDNGRVSFAESGAGFGRQWNAKCVDKPHGPPPSGAGGLRWGSHPPASLKQYAPTTGDGLALYVPKTAPSPLEGISVAEADYSFDHGRLFSADFYIDGEAGRDAIVAACVKKYGTPQAYDEAVGSYEWKWRSSKISIRINYEAKHNRTTVNFSRD